jgi:DNA-binding SARP family transcriptional activator
MSFHEALPSVTLALIGGFALRHGNAPVPVRPRAQRVLALVALRSCISRHELTGTLWPDLPGVRAAASMRSTLWRMPRPAGQPLVEARAEVVRLAPGVLVDVLATGAEPEPPATALAGDLLPDWDEGWLVIEREVFRQARLHALDDLSARCLRHGNPRAALDAGLAAVRVDPLRESAHRRVIEVHLAEGNAAEALRQYELYRRALRDELGLSPSAQIRRLVAPLLGRPAER